MARAAPPKVTKARKQFRPLAAQYVGGLEIYRQIASPASTHQQPFCHCAEPNATGQSQLTSIDAGDLCPLRDSLHAILLSLRAKREILARDEDSSVAASYVVRA